MSTKVVTTQPKISEETLKEMSSFFMKTSIPRIIAEMQKQNKQEEDKKS